MDINNMTAEQLKALTYDQMMILKQAETNIQILQREIEYRQRPKPVEEKKETP